MGTVDYGRRAQAAEIFLMAAAYIRQYGWQVEGMSRHGKPRCSMGALASVWPVTSDASVARLMYDVLYEELNGLSLTEFNHEFKSGEKVAQLYEQVSEKLELSRTFAQGQLG